MSKYVWLVFRATSPLSTLKNEVEKRQHEIRDDYSEQYTCAWQRDLLTLLLKWTGVTEEAYTKLHSPSSNTLLVLVRVGRLACKCTYKGEKAKKGKRTPGKNKRAIQ